MSTIVTLKLSPTEFDNLKTALITQAATLELLARDDGHPPQDRHEARQEAMQYRDIQRLHFS